MNEDKRTAYQEISTNYRFFAGWRQLTFAGGVLILGGVLQMALERGIYRAEARLACFAAAICEIVLMLVDQRTREHTGAAVEAGIAYEGADGGFFTQLDRKKDWPSHTFGARTLFIVSALILFAVAFRWVG